MASCLRAILLSIGVNDHKLVRDSGGWVRNLLAEPKLSFEQARTSLLSEVSLAVREGLVNIDGGDMLHFQDGQIQLLYEREDWFT
jgi:hypothetical protein